MGSCKNDEYYEILLILSLHGYIFCPLKYSLLIPKMALSNNRSNNRTSTLTSVTCAPINQLNAIRGACKTSRNKKNSNHIVPMNYYVIVEQVTITKHRKVTQLYQWRLKVSKSTGCAQKVSDCKRKNFIFCLQLCKFFCFFYFLELASVLVKNAALVPYNCLT